MVKKREVILKTGSPENKNRVRPKTWLLTLGVIAVIAVLVMLFIARPRQVEVIKVNPVSVTQTLTATGQVEGARRAQIGSNQSGIIDAIYAREGDRVVKGQPLFKLYSPELDAQVQQARQAVQTAQAQLNQVMAGPQRETIQRQRSELARVKQVNQAQVAAAEARLRDLQQGARATEIREAQAQVRQLQATEAQAASDLKRAQILVKQGAQAAVELERARTALETARENRRAAQQRLQQLREGSRTQEIQQARAQLEAARAEYRNAVRSAEAALQELLSQPRPEDVRVARARVQEAQAALHEAEVRRSQSVIYAPFNGIIAQLIVEKGQSMTPNQPAMILDEVGRPEIKIDLDENQLGLVSVGQRAVVSSQAYPDQRVYATVTEIAPRVDPEQGTVEVTLVPDRKPSWLRSNLTVDGTIITAASAERLMIPADTVKTVSGNQYVLVVQNGRAVRKQIVTGGAGPQGIVVVSGIRAGDLVVRNSEQIRPGIRVTTG